MAVKYAAKSGVEITFWEMENNGAFFNGPTPQGCPTKPVCPPGVCVPPPNRNLTGSPQYLSGNLQGGVPQSSNYTPTFCAAEGKLSGGGNCTYYVITSNGFAGGTEREVTAEVGYKNGGNCTGIYVETELPNG